MEQVASNPICLRDGPVGKLSDEEIAGFPFDEGQDTVFAVSHDGIAFPVSQGESLIDVGWPFINRAFPLQSPAAVFGAIAFAFLHALSLKNPDQKP